MNPEFLKQTSIITYSSEDYSTESLADIDQIVLHNDPKEIRWYNTYGLDYPEEFKQVILKNDHDEFLIKLLEDRDHSNKLIELDDLLFISIRILQNKEKDIDSEQMFFICSTKFIWSIQEKKGDHFGWIRDRIANNHGIVRRKNADYLLFLMLEAVIDNYDGIVTEMIEESNKTSYVDIQPTPEFTCEVENRKNLFYEIKKATMSLRDLLVKFEKLDDSAFQEKYFGELKEQSNNLISEIDFALQDLGSLVNLIFSIQGYRLNEIMKTLTILSAIFIPITFIAGVFGMNFKNMPGLDSDYGFYITMAIMILIALFSVWHFHKRKWF